jgi:hypothetical protein
MYFCSHFDAETTKNTREEYNITGMKCYKDKKSGMKCYRDKMSRIKGYRD